MGKIVILDPAPVPIDFQDSILKYTDIVKPNETELGILTGADISAEDFESVKRAVKGLKVRGARNVVVSLGPRGAFVSVEGGEERIVPSHKVEAVDTTAAGDSFVAAMAIKYAEGNSLFESVSFANKVSAIVVTRKGAQTSIPRIEEIA